jgi:hypothetical protein
MAKAFPESPKGAKPHPFSAIFFASSFGAIFSELHQIDLGSFVQQADLNAGYSAPRIAEYFSSNWAGKKFLAIPINTFSKQSFFYTPNA